MVEDATGVTREKIIIFLVMILVAMVVMSTSLWTVNPPASLRDVGVDCSVVTGRIRSLQGMNCGPLEIMHPRQIGEKERIYDFSMQYLELGVDYVRTHGQYGWGDIDIIFPNFDADLTLPSSYNFTISDYLIKGIKAVGANVIFRLGYNWGVPHASTSYIGASDYEKWAEVCKHIVMHYNDGWSDGFHYDIPYWEIWNEPDFKVFWTGTPEEYFRLYEVTARTLKAYNPDLKVGSPGLAGNVAFAKDFLRFCMDHDVPLDFFSYHLYPLSRRYNPPHSVCDKAAQFQELLDEYGLGSVESLLTEWNMAGGGSHEEYWNTWGAAYTASYLMYIQDTDIAIANRHRGDAHGMGLFNMEGIAQKPFYAFKAFKLLLETCNRLICTGSDESGYAVMAGKSDDDKIVTVLISDVNSEYGGYRLEVNNLPWRNKAFKYERYLLDDSHNLELIEPRDCSESDHFLTTEYMAAPSVQLIRLSVKE